MDDPISALDLNVRKKVFLEVFQGVCKDRTRILATHALDFLHHADTILLMDKGRVTAQGTLTELQENP
jgi:ABC-type bacteriocin/lantibiotic exporter with double-glycine peptidase domain